MPPERSILSELKSATAARFQLLGIILVTLWSIEIVDWFLLGGRLDQYGILPRTLIGLRGILVAPLLHGDFSHLMANTIPLLTLSWWVMLRSVGTWLAASTGIVLIGGLGTWLLGAGRAVHIGASGLVFGYMGYLLARGYRERTVGAVAIALFVLVTYGAMFWGLLPSRPGISWESHLFGFVGGVIMAYAVPSKADIMSDR